MKNDRPPACKYEIWLMGNKESSLPGLIVMILNRSHTIILRHCVGHGRCKCCPKQVSGGRIWRALLVVLQPRAAAQSSQRDYFDSEPRELRLRHDTCMMHSIAYKLSPL